jgi:hypothetical protein
MLVKCPFANVEHRWPHRQYPGHDIWWLYSFQYVLKLTLEVKR